jgi:hypothetical protein
MRIKPSEQTIKKLFALSGNICAFPDCNQKIIDEHGNLIGEICHIEAANPDGERYNPAQSDQERASFENLIVLCANHHKVTNNVSFYTVALLKAMKTTHEGRFTEHQYSMSEKELNTVLYSMDHNLNEIAKNTERVLSLTQQLKFQNEPSISLMIKENENQVQIINLIIENVGNKIAKNIRFEVNPPGFITLSGDPITKLYIFQCGIPILPPRQKIIIPLVNFAQKIHEIRVRHNFPLSDSQLSPSDGKNLRLITRIESELEFIVHFENEEGEQTRTIFNFNLCVFWGLRFPSRSNLTLHSRTDTTTGYQTDASGNMR